MKHYFLNRILLPALVALAVSDARADEEPDLIAILQSTAGAPQKCVACQKLRIVGTAESVPALAALLSEERVSHAARYALEGIPGPAAGAALREALGQNAGLIRLGLIDSLGWRRERDSVPLLVPLLARGDSDTASAAAVALGRIGGPEAIEALTRARDTAHAAVKPAVLEALLQTAEQLLAAGDKPGAAAIYRGVFSPQSPVPIRTAAWRGLVFADAPQRADRIVNALAGTDGPLRRAALELLRELKDAQVVRACLREWSSLTPDAQLAVLDAHVAFGSEALPTIRSASTSPDLTVRVAAWRAFAQVNDLSSIPALATTAARGEPPEREAARETLSRLRGPGAGEALLAHLSRAEPTEQAELLRALGDRGDTHATGVLLRYAGAESEPVRRAALESLRSLAVADTLGPLLDLAARSTSEAQRQPVLNALYAVCQASPDKDRTSHQVIESLNRFPVAARRHVLRLLAELGTVDSLAAALAASRDSDTDLVKEAIRVLTQWPNAAPAPPLLELARASADVTVQTLALRGAITVAGQEPDLSQRLAVLREALAMARRTEDKKQVLGQLGRIPTPEALELARPHLADPDLANEAGLAAVGIAEQLAGSSPKLAEDVAVEVLAHCQDAETVRRAWALRRKPAAGGPFIRDWLVCGPYREAGVTGAEAVFHLAFGPEKPGDAVEWRSVPAGDHANLAALFPGQENCVAYLKARLIAPEDMSGMLLLGSDDGVKAWLNGVVVHSHNIDRGQVPDQDVAPIQLKKGANELLLKVSQGGGGWSACARIVGADGRALEGLRVQSLSVKNN